VIGEWVGVYREENEIIVSLPFQTSPTFSPKCTMVAPCLNIPIEVKLYLVGSYFRMHTLLGNVKASSRGNLHCIEWVMAQIEVVEIINGPHKGVFSSIWWQGRGFENQLQGILMERKGAHSLF
jgi:hypothetical protein